MTGIFGKRLPYAVKGLNTVQNGTMKIGGKMKETVLNKKLVIKYLEYLNDFSNQLVSKHDFNSSDFDTFLKEYNLFIQRLSDAPGMDRQLKNNLLEICDLEPEVDRPVVDGFLKRFFGFNKNTEQFVDEQYKNRLREIRDRIANLLFQIEKYTFFE
jgi:hypothetical protein